MIHVFPERFRKIWPVLDKLLIFQYISLLTFSINFNSFVRDLDTSIHGSLSEGLRGQEFPNRTTDSLAGQFRIFEKWSGRILL